MNSLSTVIFSAVVASAVMGQTAVQIAQASGQLPSICSRIIQFGQCNSKAANNMASCNTKVTDVPDFSYWECVCAGQQEMLKCYSICSDDPNLQLQYQTQVTNKLSTCEYVQQMKDAGLDAPTIESNATTVVNGQTINVPVPKKKPLPPLPKNNRTGPVVIDGNAAGSIQTTLGASLLAVVGFIIAA